MPNYRPLPLAFTSMDHDSDSSDRKIHRYIQFAGPLPPDETTGKPGDVFIVVKNGGDTASAAGVPTEIYARGKSQWEKWECHRPEHPLVNGRVLGISKPTKGQRVYTWLGKRHVSHLANYNGDIQKETRDVLDSSYNVRERRGTSKAHRQHPKSWKFIHCNTGPDLQDNAGITLSLPPQAGANPDRDSTPNNLDTAQAETQTQVVPHQQATDDLEWFVPGQENGGVEFSSPPQYPWILDNPFLGFPQL
ncbi:hypothetical protein FA15DRAFT_753285 [Coprinopsis marcescibilis]|uniref:Uncharacterized protein n=1 Tax=Coprinopsis marcescibilis TaxID=230819 RepID=A0A5C3L7B9_COPMA|nr:hypothetical protein FA15DRAFT_753285 [Coprinopsis marcescibilis]